MAKSENGTDKYKRTEMIVIMARFFRIMQVHAVVTLTYRSVC